ncbi:hypothetical protein Tco_0665116, partial [Tanacetum coccineum]
MHPSWLSSRFFSSAQNRQERRSENRKSLQQSSIVKSLATWGKDRGITTLLKSILDGFALGSFVQGGGDFLEERVKGNTNIKQCLRKVADGYFTKAVKGSAIAIYLLKVIASVVNFLLTGRCPSIFAKFVAFAPLTPLLKPDNVSDGVEAILHSLNIVLSGYHNDRSLAMHIVDLLNAFNLVYKSASLHEQDDPLGPILFAFVLHLLVHKIKDSCKLLLHAWYLDDGTVIEDSEEVAKVLDIIKLSGPGLGLELNIKKTDIFWPSCNGMKLRECLFHVDIRRPSSGVKLVGGAVSRDAYFISGLAMRR